MSPTQKKKVLLFLYLIKHSRLKMHGGLEVQLHTLCLAPDGGVSCLNCFTPGKGPYYLLGGEKNTLTMPERDLPATPSHYTY